MCSDCQHHRPRKCAVQAKEDKKKNGLLVLACARGYIGDVDQLLDTGADARAVDKRKVSAIHYACAQGRLEVVQRLYRRGVELDVEDSGGHTPMHWAVLGGHARVVEFLLAKGAWAEGYTSHDDTPLHLAARQGNDEIIRLLLNSGGKASVGDTNRRSLTPLGEALVAGHASSAELLIKEGKSAIDARPQGLSLLHLAAAVGKAPSLKLLLARKGIHIDDGDTPDGITPLHCAALAGSEACARLLLDVGADASLASHDGRLPQDLLAQAAEGSLRKLLQPSKRARASANGGPPRIADKAAAAKAPPARSAAQAAFQALSEAQRASKVQHWAELEEGKLQAATRGLWPAVLAHVQQVRFARQGLAIQRGIVELLEDDDFQRDSDHGRLDDVVADIKARPQLYEKYANDPATMHALTKLKRYHSLVKASGQPQAPLESILRSHNPGWQDTNARRLQGLERMAEAHTRAACTAALADSEQAAESTACAIVESYKAPAPASPSTRSPAGPQPSSKPSKPQKAPPAGSPSSSSRAAPNTAPASPSSSPGTSAVAPPAAERAAEQGTPPGTSPASGSEQGSPSKPPLAHSTPPSLQRRSRSVGGASIPQRGGSTSEIEAADDGDLGAWEDRRARADRARTQRGKEPRWGQVFTWGAFWRELKRQLLHAVAMFCLTVVVFWVMGFPLPWARTDQSQAAALKDDKAYEPFAPVPLFDPPDGI